MSKIIYTSPRERRVHKAVVRFGDCGATVFEVRKIIGLYVLPGTVNNCIKNLTTRGLVTRAGCTSDADRIGRRYGESDVYQSRSAADA
jgi:hypothetical protein